MTFAGIDANVLHAFIAQFTGHALTQDLEVPPQLGGRAGWGGCQGDPQALIAMSHPIIQAIKNGTPSDPLLPRPWRTALWFWHVSAPYIKKRGGCAAGCGSALRCIPHPLAAAAAHRFRRNKGRSRRLLRRGNWNRWVIAVHSHDYSWVQATPLGISSPLLGIVYPFYNASSRRRSRSSSSLISPLTPFQKLPSLVTIS